MPREYKKPTDDEKKTLYEFYELIYESSFSPSKKRSLMTAALGYETWSWRVVGITEEAIKAIARNNFNKPSKVLARDHRQPRAETYKKIFNEKMPFQKWWDWVWEHDKTTLVTNAEHHSGNFSDVYDIDPEWSYFVDAEVAGWHQTKGREGAFVKQLCEKHSIIYELPPKNSLPRVT